MKILIWIDKQSLPFFTISQGFINPHVCLCQGIKTSSLAVIHAPPTPTLAQWYRRVDGSIS